MNPDDQQPIPQPIQPQQPQPLNGPVPRIPGQAVHPALTPELEQRHADSKRKYPQLSLSAGEFVIEEVKRHPIGIVSIWVFVLFLAAVVIAALSLYGLAHDSIAHTLMIKATALPSAAVLALPGFLVVGLVVLFGIVSTAVYQGNKFYVTSESIIQFVQTGLFNTKQQTVALINVEDCSSEQNGIVAQLLNYGTLKLSTQGEETVYHFRLVANPKRVVNLVIDASEKAVKILQGYPVNEW
ncbi:MAG TPA: PH domain-containing protein [Candidatus Saccharimonas sp.]|nr:PH domain-containing protein [Candidatus Saccharimonas sp.]